MSDLASLRTSLRAKLKSSPEPIRPFIHNVVATLGLVIDGPACQRDAARMQTLRNIEQLERARRAYVA